MSAIKPIKDIFAEIYDHISYEIYSRICNRVNTSIYNPVLEFQYNALYDESFNNIRQIAYKIHTLDDIEDILAAKLNTYIANDTTRRNHRTNK
jgi:hypothetical protein